MLLIYAVVLLLHIVQNLFGISLARDSEGCGHDLCLERLGEKDVSDSQRFLQQNCFCDDECTKYNDCCLDAANGSQVESEFKCDDVLGINHGVYMIGHCPVTWTNAAVTGLCQNPDPEDPFSAIPIYSKDTKISYKNMYCAVCHQESEGNLISWNVHVKCQTPGLEDQITATKNQNIFFNKTRGRWHLITAEHEAMQTECLLYIKPQLMLYRPCKKVIDFCAENWMDMHIETKCKSLNAYRYEKNNDNYIIYKNTYCALCNTVDPKRLDCLDSNEKTFSMPPLNYSLSWSLDLQYESITPECGFGEIYDAFSHMCRNVLCPDCLMFIGKIQNSNTSDTKDYFKCHLYILPQSHYEITENGILLPNVQKIIPTNLYFLDPMKTLYVCDAKETLTKEEILNVNMFQSNLVKDFVNDLTNNPIEMTNKLNKNVLLDINTQIYPKTTQLITEPPLQTKNSDFCFKISLKLFEFNLNPQTQSFFVPMLNRTFYKGEYSLDEIYHPVICDPVDLFYSIEKNCWEIALHPWTYKYQNGSLFVDIMNKYYKTDEYSFNDKQEPTICISIDPETNQNKDILCPRMMIPPEEIKFEGDSIYIHKFDKTFNSSQYFKDAEGISICLASVRKSCTQIMVKENDYILHSNNTIYVGYMNLTFYPNEYELMDGFVSICVENMYESEPLYSTIQGIVTMVGLGISITCLALHLLIYFFTTDQKHLGCKNVAILAATVMAAQMLWLIHPIATGIKDICTSIAILGHFMYLASFAWMGVISFDVWRTFSRKYHHQHSFSSDRSRFLKYSICAWSIPIIIITIALTMDFLVPKTDYHPCYQCGACWIRQRWALLVFFKIPIAVILFNNILLFILTLCNIFKAFTAARKARRQEIHEILISCKLAILMGLTWIIGFYQQRKEMQYLFIILNTLQGVLIFIGFTFNKSVRRSLGETVAKISVHRQFSNSPSIRTNDTDFSSYKRTLSCKSSQSVCTDPSAGYPSYKTPFF